MEKQDIVNEFKKIASKANLHIEISEHEDASYVDVLLTSDNIDLYIIISNISNHYVAYGIESSALPREFYPDSISGQEAERSTEVIENVRKIVDKDLQFHPHPGLLNKNRGYIVLTLNGKPTKVYQKYNAFDLPSA